MTLPPRADWSAPGRSIQGRRLSSPMLVSSAMPGRSDGSSRRRLSTFEDSTTSWITDSTRCSRFPRLKNTPVPRLGMLVSESAPTCIDPGLSGDAGEDSSRSSCRYGQASPLTSPLRANQPVDQILDETGQCGSSWLTLAADCPGTGGAQGAAGVGRPLRAPDTICSAVVGNGCRRASVKGGWLRSCIILRKMGSSR